MKTYNFLMERIYHTTLQVEAENEQEAREKLKALDVYSIELEQCCVVSEDITLENTTDGKKYARICSVTGQGMWDGWVFNEGEFYAIDEMSAQKVAADLGYKDLEDAYNEGAAYWTDWSEDEKENAQYIFIDGLLYDYAGEDAPTEIYGTDYKPIFE